MDIQSLEKYLVLCQNLHFGRTSEQIHTSPSALSRMVRRLEDELGHELLYRDNRKVVLTAKGEVFRTFAENTLGAFEKLTADLGAADQRLTGRLTLFASVTASQSILPRVLARFREQHPDIQIQLETGYAVNALQRLDEGVDVVVAALPEVADERLVRRIIMDIPILTVAPLKEPNIDLLLNRRVIDWSDVPLILPSTGQARGNIDEWLRDKRIRPKIYSEVAGNEAILSLVALGCGVGFVPKLVLDESPLKRKVRVIERGPKLDDFHVGFGTRRRNLLSSALVGAFWESIQIEDGQE